MLLLEAVFVAPLFVNALLLELWLAVLPAGVASDCGMVAAPGWVAELFGIAALFWSVAVGVCGCVD
jgi:hypothetical protein